MMVDKLVIGVTGGSGSGKTAISKSLMKRIGVGKVSLLQQDNYYKDLSYIPPKKREFINFDHPDSFDNEKILKDILKLIKGEDVYVPKYDFLTHTRKKEKELLHSREVIILEGIFLLVDEKLRRLFDVSIFVKTSSDLRFIRRLQRDFVERGRKMDSVIQQYLATVRPMHDKFVEPKKKYADIIILGDENIDHAVEIILNYLDKGLYHG